MRLRDQHGIETAARDASRTTSGKPWIATCRVAPKTNQNEHGGDFATGDTEREAVCRLIREQRLEGWLDLPTNH